MTPDSCESLLKVTGVVNLKLFNSEGKLIDERTTRNLVVTDGKNLIAGRMKDTVSGVHTQPAQPAYMSIGTSSTSAAPGDKDLIAPVPANGTNPQANRKALTTAGGTVSANTVTYTAEFAPNAPANATGTIQEAAIYNSNTVTGSGATAVTGILARTTFGTITKNSGDTLQITWTLTIN